jgi:hypothetical protein
LLRFRQAHGDLVFESSKQAEQCGVGRKDGREFFCLHSSLVRVADAMMTSIF